MVWLDVTDALPAEPTLLLPAAALVPAGALVRLLNAAPGAVLAESLAADAPVIGADVALLEQVRGLLGSGAPLGDALSHILKDRDLESVTTGESWYVRVAGPRTPPRPSGALW